MTIATWVGKIEKMEQIVGANVTFFATSVDELTTVDSKNVEKTTTNFNIYYTFEGRFYYVQLFEVGLDVQYNFSFDHEVVQRVIKGLKDNRDILVDYRMVAKIVSQSLPNLESTKNIAILSVYVDNEKVQSQLKELL